MPETGAIVDETTRSSPISNTQGGPLATPSSRPVTVTVNGGVPPIHARLKCRGSTTTRWRTGPDNSGIANGGGGAGFTATGCQTATGRNPAFFTQIFF